MNKNLQAMSSSVQAHFQDEKYSPAVHPDGSVTFRLKAPMAQKVQIEPHCRTDAKQWLQWSWQGHF